MKLFHEIREAEDLPETGGLVHADEVVQVVGGARAGDGGVGGRRLQPAPVFFSHVATVGREILKKRRRRDDSEYSVVLGVQDGVRPECLCHIFVEIGGERQDRIEVVDEGSIVRTIDEDDVVVPDDEFLFVPSSLLPPQRDDALLVRNKHGVALVQLVLVIVL